MKNIVAPRLKSSFSQKLSVAENVTCKSKDRRVNLWHLLKQESFEPCIHALKLLGEFAPQKKFTCWIRSDLSCRAFARSQHMVVGVGSVFSYVKGRHPRHAHPRYAPDEVVQKQIQVVRDVAHEATHLAIHGVQAAGIPVHRREFEACQWAAWFVGQDLLPDADANYVGQKIDMGFRRGLQRVDHQSWSAAKWDWSHTPPEMMQGMSKNSLQSDGWSDWSLAARTHPKTANIACLLA